MSIDIQWLKSKKVSAGDYKLIFSADPADYTKQQQALVNILRNRTQDGFTSCLSNFRHFAAIDIACDVSFHQNTPTFVRHILSKNLDAKGTMAALESWGLSKRELFKEQTLEDGTKAEVLNRPLFYNIVVPLVMAYLTGREARLFNQRVGDFLKYKPLKQLSQQRISCEIVTDIVNNISRNYGYPATFRQAIHQTLKYGVMLAFPEEQWHCETQVLDGRRTTIKEGIRYKIPHPSNLFYDLNYPLPSINSDTGIEFAGHWGVNRYGDILDDRRYWNRSKIYCGNNWFKFNGAATFFDEFYPCQLRNNFPTPSGATYTREDKACWYNRRGDRDKALFLTQHYMKLSPRQWGLGDYPYKIWHRFVIAGSDTIIYAEPFAYNPIWFMGYDYDFNASRNDSLALQLIPWQDQLGNILTNILQVAYRNLRNLTFYNKVLIDPKYIDQLQASGFEQYSNGNYAPFDPQALVMGRQDPDKLFQTVEFPQTNIQEMLTMVNLLLSIMERVQQFSAQESGAAASHQQSVEEIKTTGGATSNRLDFTGSFIDEGVDGWKRQLLDGAKAYLDPDLETEVSANIPDLEKHLVELGFDIIHRGDDKWSITGHKSGLRIEQFAASNEGPEETSDRATSQAMFAAIALIAQNPDLHQEVTGRVILKMVETATRLGGAPNFTIELPPPGTGTAVPKNVSDAIQAALQQVIQALEQKQLAPAAEHISKVEQELKALEQTVQQLMPLAKAAQAAQDKNQIEMSKAQTKAQLDQARFVAEETRKQESHQAELSRQKQESDLKSQLEVQKAGTKAVIEHHAALIEASQPEAVQPQAQPAHISESLSYKDAPEEIRAQIEQQSGLIPPSKRTYLKKEKTTASKKPSSK